MKKKKEKSQDNRLYLIDAIRALAIISMIFYHGYYDYLIFSGKDSRIIFSGGYLVWEQTICWTFILVSGFCRALGHKNLKRGLTVLFCAGLVSLGTYLFTPEDAINFGILAFMGSAMLITIPFDKLFKKINPWLGLIINGILFFLSYDFSDGFMGFGNLHLLKMPDFLYRNYFTSYLGFPSPNFSSGDYFPILPWIFLFFCGYFISCIVVKKPAVMQKLKFKIPVLSQIGKYSLLIYLVHQVILYYGFMLLF